MSKDWYVLHTYTAQEDKVKDAILNGLKDSDFENLVGEILIPKQKTFHIREGKKIERERKIFNSYIIIECELTKQLYTFIINTPGVTHFLGAGKTPIKLSQPEIDRLLGISDRSTSKANVCEYLVGDKIKIINGPFNEFDGIIDKVNPDNEKLTIKVTVFGRVTPVEVSMDQVELL